MKITEIILIIILIISIILGFINGSLNYEKGIDDGQTQLVNSLEGFLEDNHVVYIGNFFCQKVNRRLTILPDLSRESYTDEECEDLVNSGMEDFKKQEVQEE